MDRKSISVFCIGLISTTAEVARDALSFIDLKVRQTDGLDYSHRLGLTVIPTPNPLILLAKQG